MAFDYDKLMNWPFEPIEQTYTEKDSILYALGVGLGADPMDRNQLRYVFEEADDFAALPTMPVVLASPGFWARNPDTGIDWQQILHGEQGIILHRSVPTAATLVGTTKVIEIVDKGPKIGALIYQERTLVDKHCGEKVATLHATTFARGDGGCGGPGGSARSIHPIPDADPDATLDLPTMPQSALLYRLSGDLNPLHASPEVAVAAGFDRPILHGLCTFGVAGYALLKLCSGDQPSCLRSMNLRFSAPVFPGETIRTEIWRHGSVVSFRAKVVERNVVVLNNGRAEFSD